MRRFSGGSWLMVFACLYLAGCGGGSKTPPPANPDFSLTLQPSTLSVLKGQSTNMTVSVSGLHGFAAAVDIVISGAPSGVTATPSSFRLSPAGQQNVSVSAASGATAGMVTLSVAGASGALAHSVPVSLSITEPADFTLTVQPATIAVPQGSSATTKIAAAVTSGSSGPVSVSITGLPATVTVSPSTFTLAAGAQQAVTFATNGTADLDAIDAIVTGTSAAYTHTVPVRLMVVLGDNISHAPMRTRYLRTDAEHDLSWVEWTPQPITVYDPPTKRFFQSNTYMNRIEVFDATTQTHIGQIPVPGAFTLDETADHATLWASSIVGDLYAIDPISMSVLRRYAAIEIGPSGYAPSEARVLADGRLALLGDPGGLPAIDGFNSFAIWNPADNSLQKYAHAPDLNPCGFRAMTQFALTADRTKVLVGTPWMYGSICLFDPATGEEKFNTFEHEVMQILVPRDGKEILVATARQVTRLDAHELWKLGEFPVGDGSEVYRYALSFDGSTLFATSRLEDNTLAYSTTGTQTGWAPNIFLKYGLAVTPQVADETGLIAGISEYGTSFIDASGPKPLPAPRWLLLGGGVGPLVGASSGGTQTKVYGVTETNVADVWFGAQTATGLTHQSDGLVVTTPTGIAGPVDVAVTTTTPGAVKLLPESFTFGPYIMQVVTKTSAAEGGTGLMYGYGFSSCGTNGLPEGTVPADLRVSVNGQPSRISTFWCRDSELLGAGYPFEIQTIQFAIPSGTPGGRAAFTVANSFGETTAEGALDYLSGPVSQYPLPGADLMQGIYDARRDLYYFTDASQVQVFSPTLKRWLAPLAMPGGADPAVMRLWGLALSPDGSRLAVADAGARRIYVLDMDSPASGQSFTVPDTISFERIPVRPSAIAITDSGAVYFVTFTVEGIYNPLFHKLDTSTGTLTDYAILASSEPGAGSVARAVASSDNQRIYFNTSGNVSLLDVVTDIFYECPGNMNVFIYRSSDDLALASNGTWMFAAERLLDTNLNLRSFLVPKTRETWHITPVYGSKLSPDGKLLFSPLTTGIDVVDGRTGTLRTRVALPVTISSTYDALVSNGMDNALVAITGENSDGIAFIDLNSVPEPPSVASASQVSAAPLPLATGAVLRNRRLLGSVAARGVPAASSAERGSGNLPSTVRAMKAMSKYFPVVHRAK